MTHRRPRTFALTAGVILVWLAGSAFALAQVGTRTYCSLEWLAADADVIARGVIANVERQERPKDRVLLIVTLAVHESIKGDTLDSITFPVETLASDRRYDAWKAARQEQLWFLKANSAFELKIGEQARNDANRFPFVPYGQGCSVLRLDAAVQEESSFSRLPPPILTLELSLLDQPREILAAVRDAVAESRHPDLAGGDAGGALKQHALWLPRCVAQRCGSSGDVNYLIVPVDRRLELLARRLIAEPEEFANGGIAPYGDPTRASLKIPPGAAIQAAMHKEAGIRALAHFRSDENIAALKQQLNDPSWSIHTIESGAGPDKSERVYLVRKAACEVLQQWNVHTPAPVLREPVVLSE